MSSPALSPVQVHALFDILTHHEVYSEVELWKWPKGSDNEDSRISSSPLLRQMFKEVVTTLPSISTLSPDFWQLRVGPLLNKLSGAELSESYDKGNLGTRKTLSTAHSVVVENAARGFLGGCPIPQDSPNANQYDRLKAEDLQKAWDKTIHQIIYGTLIDDLFDAFARSGDMENLSPMVQAALKHIFLLLASFFHHVFVLSPSGQDILQLISSANKSIPYKAIKQALRVGNVATMINGILKLLLTKISLKAVTNWVGISKGGDDGMNLLQSIISTVLGWDNAKFKEIITKIKKDKSGPSKEHLDTIETYLDSTSRSHHEHIRALSIA